MLNPEVILASFGSLALIAVLVMVFAETGLLVGFFLPGDSLLFVTGMLTAAPLVAGGDVPFINYPIWLVCLLIGIAAVLGDQTGFRIGGKLGPAIFKKEEGLFFHKDNVERTDRFFKQFGPKSIVLARFVPIVRTFIPTAAGVAKMNYKTFTIYNIIGALLWGVGVTLLGYFLGNNEFVHHNIEKILIAIVGVSVIPVGIEIIKGFLAKRK